MKLNRLLTASLLGFSLLTTSAFACEHSSSNSGNSAGSHWSFLDWCHNIVADSKRECDQNGQDSGKGRNCDRGKGNGGGYCGTGGSGGTTGGSTGGGTVGPKG